MSNRTSRAFPPFISTSIVYSSQLQLCIQTLNQLPSTVPPKKMLRRKPTAITITPEDLISFEEERLRQQTIIDQAKEAANTNRTAESESAFTGKKYDPNDELKPLPGDKAKIVRTRDERIGVNRRT
ncbi:hypothetical protein PISL3812_09259 [Talaromyces islandicus]|uniref:Anaphase-promoting complex subunit CDC26 n=1 Tax=Talaromyces islandicus TaxID=28573 RepID=A0A0U1M983_TALIS|nr:hypothetical protein PISL3812_09259 [Talaromyces islandicus]